MQIHRRLEEKIARFKGTEAALLYPSGYMANIGIISALVGRGDMVFGDRLNHASIIDGCLLSGAEFRRYPHRDTDTLEHNIKMSYEGRWTKDDGRKRLIVTDSIFSMDGDIAPLPELVELAKKYDCMLMVDEAHATGVLGKNGRGAIEHFGLDGDELIQMGTLGKAFGGFGAYVAGSKVLIDYLINKSRSFIYTTSLPPAVVAAAAAALKLIQDGTQLRRQLWDNVGFFKSGLKEMGLDTMESQTQIIPVLIGDNERAVDFSKRLFEKGVLIQAIRPPTVPKGKARLRISLMATHSKEDLQEALEVMEEVI